MESFHYTNWHEDYLKSFNDDGDPDPIGEFGCYFDNIIEGCGLKISSYSHSLLDRGMGGVASKLLNKSQVSDRVMQLTSNEPILRHFGRKLLRINLQMMTPEFTWVKQMEALSEAIWEAKDPDLKEALKCLQQMYS